MRIGIAISTRNELEDLEATVALCFASNPSPSCVVVCDDNSDSVFDVKRRLNKLCELYPQLFCMSSDSRRGTSRTKNRAIEHAFSAGADAVVVMDSHMRVPCEWLKLVERDLKSHPNSLWCASCRGFEIDHPFLGSGAAFSALHKHPEPIWLPQNKVHDVSECSAVMGACYYFTRNFWSAIDGFNTSFFGWGCDEADLSMRAHIAGFNVMRNHKLVVQHNFQRKTNTNSQSWEPQFNQMVLCATIFEDGVFETVYEKRMRAEYDPLAVKMFDSVRDNVQNVDRLVIQRMRRRSDSEVLERSGYRHPGAWDHKGLDVTPLRHPEIEKIVVRYDESILDGIENKSVLALGLNALSFELRDRAKRFVGIDIEKMRSMRFGSMGVYSKGGEAIKRFIADQHFDLVVVDERHRKLNLGEAIADLRADRVVHV